VNQYTRKRRGPVRVEALSLRDGSGADCYCYCPVVLPLLVVFLLLFFFALSASFARRYAGRYGCRECRVRAAARGVGRCCSLGHPLHRFTRSSAASTLTASRAHQYMSCIPSNFFWFDSLSSQMP
jgi:hypothetical protein